MGKVLGEQVMRSNLLEFGDGRRKVRGGTLHPWATRQDDEEMSCSPSLYESMMLALNIALF